jgi:DNA-binding protein H-NS
MTTTTDEQTHTPGQANQDASAPSPSPATETKRRTKHTIRQVIEGFKALPTFKEQESEFQSLQYYMKDAREMENQRLELEKKQKKTIQQILKLMDNDGVTIDMLGESTPSTRKTSTRKPRRSKEPATEAPANAGQGENPDSAPGTGQGEN